MEIDKRFDAEFQKIIGLNTNSLPWIGKGYYESTKKLLIVGESMYLTEDVDITQYDFNRKLIEKDGMLQGQLYEEDPEKFISERHKKLERILSVNPEDEKAKRIFWQKNAYYNLIQTPLKSREKKDRPHYQFFLDGWNTFFQLINIIQPAYCLINGVESFNHCYEKYSKDYGFSIKEKIKLDKLGNTYPRRIILKKESSGIEIILLFIKHTSCPMSWENWNKLVTKEMTS
jgi:hypothetical protein